MKRVMWTIALLGVCIMEPASAQFREREGLRAANCLGPTFDYPANLGRAPHYRENVLVPIPGTGPQQPEEAATAASASDVPPPSAESAASAVQDLPSPKSQGFKFYPLEFNNYFPKASVLHPYHPTGRRDAPPREDEIAQPIFPINVRVTGLEGWGLVPGLVQEFLVKDYVEQKKAAAGNLGDAAAVAAFEQQAQAEVPHALSPKLATYWVVQNRPWEQDTIILDRSHYWCAPEGYAGQEGFSLATAVFPSPFTRPLLGVKPGDAGVSGTWVRTGITVHGDATNTSSPNNFAYHLSSFPPEQDHAFWKVVRREDTGELAVVLTWLLKPTTFERLIMNALAGFPEGPARLQDFGRYLEGQARAYRQDVLEEPAEQQRIRDVFATAQRFWKVRSREKTQSREKDVGSGSASASSAVQDSGK